MAIPSFVRALPLVRQMSQLKWETWLRYRERRLPEPVYDAQRLIGNRTPAAHYRRARMALTAIEQRVVQELRRDGVSVVHLNDLLPDAPLANIQAWAEAIIGAPAHQARIKLVEGGDRPEDKSGKFYLIRLLGEEPLSVDYADAAVKMGLSDPMLRIVSDYLGMFGRLAAIDLWYNVPTSGAPAASQRWHRDPEDKRLVKTFLYLRDVEESTGPFHFVVGSQNGGPLGHIRPRTKGGYLYPEAGFIEANIAPEKIRACTGKAGTLVFADTTGFHKGGRPQSGARVLFNCVYTSNAAIPLVMKTQQYKISGAPAEPLSALASYAVGHLNAMK